MAQSTLPRSLPLLMSRQLRRQDRVAHDKIQERFEQFHAENPEVYTLLVKFARQVKSSGKTTYGIEGLFSRLRWHYEIETTGDPFKLNNIFRSRYARLIMQREPDLKGFFNTRVLLSTIRKPQPQRAAA